MSAFAAPIAEQIWDMKYRLKQPDGTPVDDTVEATWRRIADALAAVEDDPAGIIFDLRGNTGGLLREAVKVSSVFLEDQNVLIERFSDGQEKIYETSGRALGTDLPVVVLANYDRYGVLPGNNINSGPGFVTADGLEKIEEFAGEYR